MVFFSSQFKLVEFIMLYYYFNFIYSILLSYVLSCCFWTSSCYGWTFLQHRPNLFTAVIEFSTKCRKIFSDPILHNGWNRVGHFSRSDMNSNNDPLCRWIIQWRKTQIPAIPFVTCIIWKEFLKNSWKSNLI